MYINRVEMKRVYMGLFFSPQKKKKNTNLWSRNAARMGTAGDRPLQ